LREQFRNRRDLAQPPGNRPDRPRPPGPPDRPAPPPPQGR
jgi:hypothetical protein